MYTIFSSEGRYFLRLSRKCNSTVFIVMLPCPRPFRPGYRSGIHICSQCIIRLNRRSVLVRLFSKSTSVRQVNEANSRLQEAWRQDYFSSNGNSDNFSKAQWIRWNVAHPFRKAVLPARSRVDRPESSQNRASTSDTLTHSTEHSRRRRKRPEEKVIAGAEAPLPLDASSRLSTLSATLPATSFRRLCTTCLSLSKPRLSFLIVLTTATAYSLYPVPALLLPTTTISPSLSALTLVFLTSGTALCCASANALNMLMEPKYDAQMSRTRNRPLVRGLIGRNGALAFAGVSGVLGLLSLWFGVNPTVSFLGGLNIVIYAGLYTPMKRFSALNTWAGALVGGIPPLMGWAAAAGQSATGNGEWEELLFSESSVGGWLLAGLLFCWQFPHFNSLSWSIREEYKNAGYRMLVWTNPRMNGRVALRYALLCFPVCFGLWWFQITDQGFLATSGIVNTWLVKEAWKFWRMEGHKGSARGLFWASVWHLPFIMVLAMVHKKGLWEGLWERATGRVEENEDESEPERERSPQRIMENPASITSRV